VFPAENAEVVGVRDVVGQEGLDRVFEVLRAPHTEETHELVAPVQGQPREAGLR
jgi:RNA polymerase-interacting CarD/CdnL/TRCF family regulator